MSHTTTLTVACPVIWTRRLSRTRAPRWTARLRPTFPSSPAHQQPKRRVIIIIITITITIDVENSGITTTIPIFITMRSMLVVPLLVVIPAITDENTIASIRALLSQTVHRTTPSSPPVCLRSKRRHPQRTLRSLNCAKVRAWRR